MEKPTSVRWRILGLLLLYAALCHFNRISISVAGNERLMKEFAIKPEVMGPVYSAYLLVYTFLMTPGGWFIDRFGSRRALLVVGLGSALFMTMTGLTGILVASSTALVTALMIVRGFMGGANAPIHPAAAHAVYRWFPAKNHSLANGLINAAAVAGIASTYVLFGLLMDRLGWPAAFMAAGVLTVVAAVLWGLYAADRPADHRGANGEEVRLIERGRKPASGRAASGIPRERWRSLAFLTLSYGAVGYFEYLFFYWMQYYFEQVLRADRVEGRIYSTVTTLSMAAGMVVGGWLTDRAQARWGLRRGRAVVPVAGLVASALLLGAGLLSRQPFLVVGCFSVALAAVGACEGAFWTTAVDLGGGRGGTAAAIVNTGGNAGGVLAPMLTPVVSKLIGSWKAGLALACLFSLVGAALWIWIDAGEASDPSPDAPSPLPAAEPSLEPSVRP